MPTPDSIDRPQPSATPWWADGKAPVVPDQIVFIDPITRKAIQTTDPTQIAALVSGGYQRIVVPGSNWAQFQQLAGPNLTIVPADGSAPVTPGITPLTPQEQAAIDATQGNINSQATASQENLNKAFQISQTGRDRAALTTKENYGASVIPTQAAGAFAGAGYHQPNHELYTRRLDRDRTLAGLADQNTSEQFQLQVGQQNVEQQRVAAIMNAYNQTLAGAQKRYDDNVDAALSWLR